MIHWAAYSAITLFAAAFVLVASVAGAQTTPTRERTAETPGSVRLYVFDCGTLHIADIGRFRLKKEEVATTDLSVACFLVAHPKGTLMWDPGAVPDAAWEPTGAAVKHRLVAPRRGRTGRDDAQIPDHPARRDRLLAGRHHLSSRCLTTTTITPPTRMLFAGCHVARPAGGTRRHVRRPAAEGDTPSELRSPAGQQNTHHQPGR